MNQKLKAGSVELEMAFIDWIKKNAYHPAEAIDPFMERSEYVRNAVDTVVEHARKKIVEGTRQHLTRLAEDTVFIAQFPMVYGCKNLDDKDMRYTVSLTIGEAEAEWVGRVWADGEYLGEVHGSGSGPKTNYLELARMHIESHIRCAGPFKPRLRKS
ncbi:hypothetical protein [Pseudoxanthomonas sacheonensis]|uniref:hypothetical protein n=1 Tax=Pseudoxanthomonas sacheonensis TaxID=443615 RepID=UPI0013D29780|nr:hypothetical protein [Pseudoxanthomonas sacheonensis]KAF1709528.1 hypothetical protein CSC73_06245 [Pseudoxanthomonas sacheonensis]